MLTNEARIEVEEYIDSIINDIRNAINTNVPKQQLISNLTSIAKRKLDNGSKQILNGVFFKMKGITLADPIISADPAKQNKVLNLLYDIQANVKLNLPEAKVEDNSNQVKPVIIGGACATLATGGVVSLATKSWIPVSVSAVIAAALLCVAINLKDDANKIMDTYLEELKKSLLGWVGSIEIYYDKEVEKIKY